MSRETPRSRSEWKFHSLEDQPETAGSRSETGEAIVMGAIGSAAPWFLTGWAHEVEIDFMIDTGCQVTILSTTVFEPEMSAGMLPTRTRNDLLNDTRTRRPN